MQMYSRPDLGKGVRSTIPLHVDVCAIATPLRRPNLPERMVAIVGIVMAAITGIVAIAFGSTVVPTEAPMVEQPVARRRKWRIALPETPDSRKQEVPDMFSALRRGPRRPVTFTVPVKDRRSGLRVYC